ETWAGMWTLPSMSTVSKRPSTSYQSPRLTTGPCKRSGTMEPAGQATQRRKSMLTVRFLKDAAERAVKTAAQAVLALVTADVTGITDLDFTQAASVAGLAVLVSVLTSVVSAPAAGDNASLVLEDDDK